MEHRGETNPTSTTTWWPDLLQGVDVLSRSGDIRGVQRIAKGLLQLAGELFDIENRGSTLVGNSNPNSMTKL